MPTNIDKLTWEFDVNDTSLVQAVERTKDRFKVLDRYQGIVTKQYQKGTISAGQFTKAMTRVKSEVLTQQKALGGLEVQLGGVDAAFGKAFKVGKGSGAGNANIALQELGRGISDFNAVGGFTADGFQRGLLASTNNLERFAEIAGYTIRQSGGLKGAIGALGKSLIGPGGLILGITVLLSFLPKIIEFFQDWKNGVSEAQKETEKLAETMEKAFKDSPQGKLNKLQEDEKTLIEEKNKLSNEYFELYSKGFRNLDGLLRKIQSKDEAIAKNRKLQLILTEQINEAIAGGAVEEGLALENEPDLFDAFDINPNQPKLVDPNDVEIIDEFADSVEDLNQILMENGRITGMLSVANTEAWLKAQEQFEKSKLTIEGASDSLISAFESAATQGGNLIQNLAGGILSAIGSMLVKEGSAYIALGIARNAAFPGSGKKVIASGAGLVAAGVGLKAAGSSVARSGRGGGSGSSAAAASTAPGSREADTTRSNVVFKIGNDALVGQMQQALDKRGTTHGSSVLFPNN